jgi:hypothetical protein
LDFSGGESGLGAFVKKTHQGHDVIIAKELILLPPISY